MKIMNSSINITNMKRTILRAVLVAATLMCSAQSHAQIGDFLKGLAGNAINSVTKSENTTASTIANIVQTLIGKEPVEENSLIGTWAYTQPCVAFESENVLTQLGSSAVSKKIEQSLDKSLTKLGFTQGKVVLTLENGGTGTVSFGTKSKKINWSVKDTNLTLKFPLMQKEIQINTKLNAGGELQLAMNSTKMLNLVGAITDKVAAANSTMGTISTLLKNVKGMYLGLTFEKK